MHTLTFCNYRFIGRAERPRAKPPNEPVMKFNDSNVSLKFKPSDGIDMEITCNEVMRRCLAMRLVCRELSPLLSWIAWTSAVASTSTKKRIARDQVGGTPWAQRNGWNFFAHLSPCRICVYHRNYGCSSHMCYGCSRGKGPQKCYPSCKLFSSRGFSHPYMSRKAWNHLLLHASSLVIL